MAQVKETYTAKISNEYACCIEYGYSDVLSEDEEKKVWAWVEKYTKKGHTVFSYGEEFYFSTCDICKLGSDVIDVTITIFEK